MNSLAHSLERSVVIRAPASTVFRYFTDPIRFAAWWGAGSNIEPEPGGAVHICYPGGVVASGEVELIEPDRRIVFTYGYPARPELIPPGGSRVTITLAATPEGTQVHLRHDVPTREAMEEHVAGWRYQMALFANVVANEVHRSADETMDRYYACWSDPDSGTRRSSLQTVVSPGIEFHDPFGCTLGLDDLVGHIAAVQRHMPGLAISRNGPGRHCQGTLLSDWQAGKGDGPVQARGTNVVDLGPDGRIVRVVGFWAGS